MIDKVDQPDLALRRAVRFTDTGRVNQYLYTGVKRVDQVGDDIFSNRIAKVGVWQASMRAVVGHDVSLWL